MRPLSWALIIVGPAGIIVLYFAGDKTVAIAPRSAFQMLSGV